MNTLLTTLAVKLSEVKMSAELFAEVQLLLDTLTVRADEKDKEIAALTSAIGTANTLMRMQDNMIERILEELQKRGAKVTTGEDLKQKVKDIQAIPPVDTTASKWE